MDNLDISHNPLGDKKMVHLSKCIHKVKRLDIYNIYITLNGMKDLSDAIMNLDEPVRILFKIYMKNESKL